jgi:VWFA-related protein
VAVLSGSGLREGRPSQDRDVLLGEFRRLAEGLHAFSCPEEEDGANHEFAPTGAGATTLSDRVKQSPSHKGSCLNSRFQLSVSTLNRMAREQLDVLGRAILIWISPGWPLLYDPEFQQDSVALRQNFFDYLVELSTTLREAQVTLDAVSSPDSFRVDESLRDHDRKYFNGVPAEDEVTSGSMALPVLAHQSGGQILKDGKDLAREIAACVADADSYYALAFDSAVAVTPGEYHSLEVKVNKLGMTVRTNTVYYAQP